jgi:DNA-binding response OmpR family regulator
VSDGGAKILLVEDDATLRHTLALNLRAEGYQLLEAEDGESGLASARAETPDLVVLDVMLPRLDGLTVCRLLRRESSVPIMLLTARGAEADKIIGLETGADDYIVKPFSLGEFLARVRAALRRRAAAPSGDVLTSGDLRLDLAARRVALAGRPVVLAPREFDLLALLLRHRGAVMSRGLLLARIWGDDYVGDDRTVDVHIHWLRQKLEKDPARPVLIQTVRGVGYRFEG